MTDVVDGLGGSKVNNTIAAVTISGVMIACVIGFGLLYIHLNTRPILTNTLRNFRERLAVPNEEIRCFKCALGDYDE